MVLTLPIRDVVRATPRARVVHIDLQGHAFPFSPGQALLLAKAGHLPRRPYSIAAAPEDVAGSGCLELLVGVDRDGRPGPHLDLTAGALVDVEGPVGRFTFPSEPDPARLLFVAGGTGIAPLRAMLRHALQRGHSTISVLYSARTPAEFAFEDELRDLAAAKQIALQLTVTRGVETNGQAREPWTGTRGRIGTELLAPLVQDSPTLCFVCGPKSLVDDIPRLLADLGVSRAAIRHEEW